MSDEPAMKLRADRGSRAQSLLQNELLQEVYVEMDRVLYEEWKETKAGEAEKRESLYLMHRANREHRHQLELIASKGKAAEKELTRLNEQSKVRRIFNG